MKAITRIDVMSAMMYGFVLVALWTLVFGIYLWLAGWIFGAQAWFIDLNLVSWTEYTFSSLLTIIWRMFVNGLGGAFTGLVVAVFYNAAAGMMGGIKVELTDGEK